MKPSPRRLTLQTILSDYASAADALAAGAYYAALVKAQKDGNRDVKGAAFIMCGWPEHGLALLGDDPAAYAAYRDFTLWTLGRGTAPGGPIRVLILAGGHTRRGIPTGDTSPFVVRSLSLERDETAPPLAEILADGFAPDLVLVLDVYERRLPEGLFDLAAPVIFWTYDFDVHLPRQYDDLARADLILTAYAEEQFLLSRIYPGRVAQFLAHDVYTDTTPIPTQTRDIQVLHTGQSITPWNRRKANYLFALAASAPPEQDIRIHNGFLPASDYRDRLSRAEQVAVYDKYVGGIQTRAMDALRAGAGLLVDAEGSATAFLDPLRRAGAVAEAFPPSPERELRLLHFAMFEAKRITRERGQRPRHPAYTEASRRLQPLLAAFAERPLDAGLRARIRQGFDEALRTHPASLALAFDYGRFLWAIDDRPAALPHFARVVDGTGDFDPTREDVRQHLLRPTQELTPFEVYYDALVSDLAANRAETPTARAVIGATARVYRALFALQSGRLDDGIIELERARTQCPDHFIAARLLAKAYVAADRPLEQAWTELLRAVELYAPSLTELLPLMVATAKRLGRDDEARNYARAWMAFASRVTWQRPDDHQIPAETWEAAFPYAEGTFLITSGAYVGAEFASIFGRLPPAFLPIGNRRLYELQAGWARPLPGRRLISLPESFDVPASDAARLGELGFEIVRVPAGLSLAASLRHVLVAASVTGPLRILHGDTLVPGFPAAPLDIVAAGSTTAYYPWAEVRADGFVDALPSGPGERRVLAGYFALANARLLSESLARSDGFVAALNDYARTRPLKPVEEGYWLDFGHLETYYRSRAARPGERAFNALDISSTRTVRKTSGDTRRMAAEAAWYEALPAELRLHTPQYLGRIEGGYAVEYLYLSPLSDLFVFGRLPGYVWERIFRACADFLEACGRFKAPPEARAPARKLYLDKTLARLAQLPADFDVGRLSDIARRAAAAIPEPSDADLRLVHGDFCFSNIFYDFRSGLVRVIDPRGRDGDERPSPWGDVRYDIAKLHHSVIGGYDRIVAGRTTDDGAEDIRAAFLAQRFAGHVAGEPAIGAISILLFLSMLPLHADDPMRQRRLLDAALRLHGEAFP